MFFVICQISLLCQIEWIPHVADRLYRQAEPLFASAEVTMVSSQGHTTDAKSSHANVFKRLALRWWLNYHWLSLGQISTGEEAMEEEDTGPVLKS